MAATGLTHEPTPRHDRDAADAVVIEVRIILLADGDTAPRDPSLQAIVALLGREHAESELRSGPGCDLVSGDRDVLSPRGRSGQRCPDRVGSLGRTSARDDPPRRTGITVEDERWVTKQQLADHVGVTARWIEYQQRHGLPHLRMGGMNRYRISEVEAWLHDRYGATDKGEAR